MSDDTDKSGKTTKDLDAWWKKIAEKEASLDKKIELAQTRVKTLASEAEIYENIMGKWSQNQLEDMNKEVELQEMKLEALQKEAAIRDGLMAQAEEARKEGEEGVALAAQLEAYAKATKEEWYDMADAIGDVDDAMKSLIEETEELDDEIEKGEKSLKKMVDHSAKADRMMDSWGKKSVIFSVNLARMARKSKDMWDPKLMKKYGKAFLEQIHPMNIFPSLALLIIERTYKLATAADDARAAFAGATGTIGQFNQHIIKSQQVLNRYGVEFKDTQEATKSLLLSTSNYVALNTKLQLQLTQTSALLKKVNVDTQDSANIFNVLTEALHIADDQAGAMMTNLLMMGTEIGISAEQMGKDWLGAMGTLAVYGPRSEGIFTNLAAAAKAAGVSTESLLAVAGKFDTFQDSAKTVAGLNALLGTNLSTTEMLMMTEDERVEHVIKTMQAQGRAFKDLDRWQKKAVANQLGFKDAAEAEMVLGMDVSQYEVYKQQMKDAADAQEQLKKAAVAAMPVATKLLHLFNEAALDVMPLLEWMGEGIDTLMNSWKELSPEMQEGIKYVLLIGGALTVAGAAFAPLIAGLGLTLGLLGGPAGAIAAISAFGLAVAGFAGISTAMGAGGAIGSTTQQATSGVFADPALETSSFNNVNSARQAMTTNKAEASSPVVRVDNTTQLPDKINVSIDGQPVWAKVESIAANTSTGAPNKTLGAGYSP